MNHRVLPAIALGLLLLNCGCSPKSNSPRQLIIEPLDDKAAIQTTWYAMYAERDASYHNDPVDGELQLVFKEDRVTVTMNDGAKKRISEGTYQVDISKSPKEIDLQIPFGGKTDKSSGIFLLENGVLHLYLGAPGKPRPTELESRPGMEYLRFHSDPEAAKAAVTQLKQARGKQYEASAARKMVAATQLRALALAAQQYRLVHGDWPNDLTALVKSQQGAALVKEDALVDPWGMPYQYDVAGPNHKGEQPDIWTEAPDKQIIGNWMRK